MDIIPEANFGIEKCIRGTKERNAIFLCSETDYMLSLQTTELPYPKQLFRFIADSQYVGIVKK
jgi:hypothetical protein